MKNELKERHLFFEDIYKNNFEKDENIPWAKMQTNPFLQEYLESNLVDGKVLVVGCGLGDDAIALELAGAKVTAIDISESAIAWCKKRFDGFETDFVVQDIFELPQDMLRSYDFVFEAFTIQSLPLKFRDKIITAISSLLAPKGKLLVVSNGKQEHESFDGPPWPLNINELKLFGMKE